MSDVSMTKEIQDILISKLVKASLGNPGAAQVLSGLSRIRGEEFMNRLLIGLTFTKSLPCALWLIFKDICKFDIEKTADYLEEWFTQCKPLEQYIDEKDGVKS